MKDEKKRNWIQVSCINSYIGLSLKTRMPTPKINQECDAILTHTHIPRNHRPQTTIGAKDAKGATKAMRDIAYGLKFTNAAKHHTLAPIPTFRHIYYEHLKPTYTNTDLFNHTIQEDSRPRQLAPAWQMHRPPMGSRVDASIIFVNISLKSSWVTTAAKSTHPPLPRFETVRRSETDGLLAQDNKNIPPDVAPPAQDKNEKVHPNNSQCGSFSSRRRKRPSRPNQCEIETRQTHWS